jgi:hypothetical protein
VATLILGAGSVVALFAVWFWARTPLNTHWAVPLSWRVVVASVACMTNAVVNIVRVITMPKAEIFGVQVGPSIG